MGSLRDQGVLLSTSQSRQEQTFHLPPQLTMAPRPSPCSARAVSSCCRLPSVTPAASAASVSVSDSAIITSSTNPQQLLTAAAQLRRVPSYGSRDKWLETCQPALLRSTVSAPTMKSSGNMSTGLCRHSTGSQGPCQQSTTAGTQMRRVTYLAANSSTAPATQHTLRSTWEAPEHLPAMPAAGSKSSLNSKSLGLHQKLFPQRLPLLPNIKTSEQPKRSCLAGAPEKQWAPLPPVALSQGSHHSGKQEAAAQKQRQAPAPQTTKATDEPLQATAISKGRKPASVSAEQERQHVEDIDNMLSQVKVVNLQNIWVKPLVPELYQDLRVDIQARPSSQSRAATGEAGEAVGDLQSMSPVPAGPTDTKPADVNLAGAAEEQQYCASLAAVAEVEEKAPAPVSSGFQMQEAVAEGQRNAFDLLSPTATELLLQEIAERLVSDILHKASAVSQETDKQRQEEQDIDENHVDVRKGAMRPAADEDAESPVAVKSQAESCSAPLVPVAGEAGEDIVSPMSLEAEKQDSSSEVSLAEHEEEVAMSWHEIPGAEAAIPHLAPGADDEGEAAASLLIQDPQHQEEPAALPTKEERQRVEDIENMMSRVKVLHLQNIWVNPLVPELYQDLRVDIQARPSSQSRAATGEAGEAVGDLQSMSPVPAGPTDTEPSAATLAGAAEEEQHCTSLAAVAEVEEKAPAPVSSGFQMQEAVAEGQRNAFDLFSPTATELLLQEIAERLVSDILHKASAVIQKRDEKCQEHEHMAQSHVDVSMAPMASAAVQDTEHPVAAEPQEDPSVDEQQTTAQAQREEPASQKVTVINRALQVLFGRKLKRAPKKHLREASTDVASSPLNKDELAVSPASVQDTEEEPGTSLSQLAQRSGQQQHVHEFSRASASAPWVRAESVQWKAPGGSPQWRVAAGACLVPAQPRTYSSPFPTRITTLPDAEAAQQRRPSRFRRALKALRRASCLSCISSQVEE
ncbi:uncharacterized protein PRD47_013173 [Ara ararauna]